MLSPVLDETVTTQLADDPLVLVVGDSSPLTRLLETIVIGQGLAVQRKTVAEAQALTPDPALYKLWVTISEAAEVVSTTRALATLSKTLAVPITIIIDSPTLIQSQDPRLQPWSQWSELVSSFCHSLEKIAPTAQIILIQDCAWEEKNHSALRYVSLAFAHQVVPECNLHWTPQSISAMTKSLQPLLFDPSSPKKVIIQGKQQAYNPTLAAVAAHYARVFQQTLRPTKMVVQPIAVSEQFLQLPTEKMSHENLTAVARSFATTLPALMANPPKLKIVEPVKKSAIPVAESENKPRPLAIPKHIPPVIKRKPVEPARPRLKPSESKPTSITPSIESTAGKPTKATTPTKSVSSSDRQPLDKDQFDQTVWQLFATQHQTDKKEATRTEAKQTITLSHKLKRRKKVAWSGAALLLTLVVFISGLGLYWGSLFVLKQALLGLAGAETPVARTSLHISGPVSQLFLTQVKLYSLILDKSWLNEGYVIAELFHQVRDTTTLYDQWQTAQQQLAQILLGGQSNFVWQNASIQATSQELYQQFTNIQADVKQLGDTNLSPTEQQAVESYLERLKSARANLSSFNQIYPLLPKLAGLEGKRTYAVVLQNNQELRPTGGFIQAIALITVDQGKWINTQVFSSYELDNKQLATVSPPQEITQLLGEKRWYIRDANWSPDFPAVATQLAWFIEHTTGKKVDGVLTIDVATLQKVIKASGPLDLPAYNEVLTDNNIWERFEFHSELQLPTGNALPEYGSYVMSQLLLQLAKLDQEKTLSVAGVLNQGLQNQGVLMSMVKPDENQVLQGLGWTGRLLSPNCPAQFSRTDCVVDVIAQVDANVGVNKANYYVKRQIDHQVSIAIDKATHKRHIRWQNLATSNAWPKGSYKAYTRFYLPETAELQTITVNGTPLPLDQVLQRFELGRKVLGIVTETAVAQTTDVELVYSTPLPGKQSFAYTFFDQRQPGTLSTDSSISFSVEDSLWPKVVAPTAMVKDRNIFFTLPDDKHPFVGVEF